MTSTFLARSALSIARKPPPNASIERYGLIRSFFLRQASTSPPATVAIPRPSRGGPICVLVSQRIRGSPLLTGVARVHATRSLQTTSPHRSEPPLKRPREDAENPREPSPSKKDPEKLPPPHDPYYLENYSKFFRQLAMSLPHLHRPTRDDFLNAATGFWSRLRVRFKWLTIRSFRKYNADDISAFVTWFFMSQTLWLFVGTTTFFSVVFATVNSLRLQEYVARAISDYLTSETGITIFFESAIVPKWKDSRISFKNVYVTRRPSTGVQHAHRPRFTDNHAIARGYDVSNHPANHAMPDEDEDLLPVIDTDEDTNYSMFDLTFDSIDVTLSLARWLEGKGLVTDAVVKGVRGVLDRRFVHWDPDHPLDPASFRHAGQPGDFELESLQLEDVLLTVYQPGHFRPYTASIFRADIRTFRKQWMFYDFLSAENVVGQFDNCLFSLHKPQSIGRTMQQETKDGQALKMSRFRIDGVNIDHLQAMTSSDGPLHWLTSGKLDAVIDIRFPRDPSVDETPLNTLIVELADAISSASASTFTPDRIPGQRELAKPPLSAPSDAKTEEDASSKVVIDIDLRFRDLKAAVPIFTNDLSYTNNALIRPIVAFMNANRTLIPIHSKVVKDLDDFEGAWTMWETGLMDIIAIKVYDAMAYHVSRANMPRRIKAVSAWSLQVMLASVRSMMNPMTEQLRDIYSAETGLPYGSLLMA